MSRCRTPGHPRTTTFKALQNFHELASGRMSREEYGQSDSSTVHECPICDVPEQQVRARDVKPFHWAQWCTVGGRSEPFANPICGVKWSEDGQRLWFLLETHNAFSADPDEMLDLMPYASSNASRHENFELPPPPVAMVTLPRADLERVLDAMNNAGCGGCRLNGRPMDGHITKAIALLDRVLERKP